MRRIVTADIGGTHARFAIASIEGGRVADLSAPVTLRTAEHASVQAAWEEFGRSIDEPLPREIAIAFAGPVGSDFLKLTNSPWVIDPASLGDDLGVERYTVLNDFGAVGHAVAALDSRAFTHVCGPDTNLPKQGVVTILGPGTGLGVAMLSRTTKEYQVFETEGGHVDFAPLDAVEDRLLVELRRSFGRVSVERLLSGRGLVHIYEALGAIGNRQLAIGDEKQLWAAAMDGADGPAAAALDRLCLILGAVAGDFALAHGAAAVVIGGGLGLRLAGHLPRSGFRNRFIAKGRFEGRMAEIPVKLINHAQPGLFGAAAAFARQHG